MANEYAIDYSKNSLEEAKELIGAATKGSPGKAYTAMQEYTLMATSYAPIGRYSGHIHDDPFFELALRFADEVGDSKLTTAILRYQKDLMAREEKAREASVIVHEMISDERRYDDLLKGHDKIKSEAMNNEELSHEEKSKIIKASDREINKIVSLSMKAKVNHTEFYDRCVAERKRVGRGPLIFKGKYDTAKALINSLTLIPDLIKTDVEISPIYRLDVLADKGSVPERKYSINEDKVSDAFKALAEKYGYDLNIKKSK